VKLERESASLSNADERNEDEEGLSSLEEVRDLGSGTEKVAEDRYDCL
jgi:hypothetical protein